MVTQRPRDFYGWVAVALLSALALALAAAGEAPRLALRYARDPIAAGEAWRLLTGHLVHLDLRHALLNAAGLWLVWALFGSLFRPVQWLAIVLAGVLAIDAGLWWLDPGLDWYVGASGVLHAMMAAGIVRQMIAGDRIAWGLAVIGSAKLAWEHVHGALPLAGATVAVVTDAHLYGAIAGAACGLVLRPARSVPQSGTGSEGTG
ncbi:MAG: rhombosortase [Steroidobacteraceae bacterium]